jgi:hypothetical protein
MNKKETFETSQTLSLENSFMTIKQDTVTLEVTVGINSEDYGWFELYDIETGGDEWYAEGGLWIENNVVTNYDGVFSLPIAVINKLKEWGYDVSEIEED